MGEGLIDRYMYLLFVMYVPGVCICKAKLSITQCYTLNGFMLSKRIQYLLSIIDCLGWMWIITRDQSFVATIFPSIYLLIIWSSQTCPLFIQFSFMYLFCSHSMQALWSSLLSQSFWSRFDKVSFYSQFSIDMSTIGAVFKKIFSELKVEPADFWVWGPVKGASNASS